MSTAPIPGVVPDVASTPPAKKVSADTRGAPLAVSLEDPESNSTADADPADLRLVIEEDKAAGSYVYMTIDPRSGKVISQIPREEVLRMREDASYKPGALVSSRT